jgi:hypothetical protein
MGWGWPQSAGRARFGHGLISVFTMACIGGACQLTTSCRPPPANVPALLTALAPGFVSPDRRRSTTTHAPCVRADASSTTA